MKLIKEHRESKDLNKSPSFNPPASTNLLRNVEKLEAVGILANVKDKVEEDLSLDDFMNNCQQGKDVATILDHPSEAGVSGCGASTPEFAARKLEDHNVGEPEGHAVLYHINEPQQRDPSSGVLGGWKQRLATVSTFIFSVLRIPHRFLVQILSILSHVVSVYSGFRSDPHEPLQRRITELETEVDKLKPFHAQRLPKHTDPVLDPDKKLSLLETEVSNTRKALSSVLLKQQELNSVLERMQKSKCRGYNMLHVQVGRSARQHILCSVCSLDMNGVAAE